MKKFIAGLLCLTFMVMIFPAQVQAENTAKAKFIKNYMAYFDQSLTMQKEMMENISDNPMHLSVHSSITDMSITMEDGTTISNIPGEAQVDAVIDFKDLKLQFDVEATGGPSELTGHGFLSPDGLVVTSETLKSLEAADMIDVEDLLDQSADTLPEYIMFPFYIDPDEKQLMLQSFEESFTTDNYEQIAAFIEQVLNVFPDSCFQYSRGESVFKLNKSILASAELLHNLKANSEPLADSFAAIMQKPASMTDEEFETMQDMSRYSMIDMIDSLELTDLSAIEEIPINIRQFEIRVSPNQLVLETDISLDMEEDDMGSMGFLCSSMTTFSSGTQASDLEMKFSISFEDGSGYLYIKSEDVTNSKGSETTMLMDLSIEDPTFSIKAKVEAEGKGEWYNTSDIIMPTLTSSNCFTAPPPVSPAASGKTYYFLQEYEDEIDILGTDGEIMVFVNGEPVWFDEAYPVIRDGRTLLPLRSLADAVYADVTWQPPDTVILDHYTLNDSMYLTINSTTYKIGEEVYNSETAPVIIGGYTYVPIRFIAETFGYEVDWHPATQSVILQD